MILNNFCGNSSFTGSEGLIIASNRSGTCFSSCLASSIYFSTTKICFSLVQLPFCVPGHRRLFSPTHFWTLQYRKVSFLSNGESLYPHLRCGLFSQLRPTGRRLWYLLTIRLAVIQSAGSPTSPKGIWKWWSRRLPSSASPTAFKSLPGTLC